MITRIEKFCRQRQNQKYSKGSCINPMVAASGLGNTWGFCRWSLRRVGFGLRKALNGVQKPESAFQSGHFSRGDLCCPGISCNSRQAPATTWRLYCSCTVVESLAAHLRPSNFQYMSSHESMFPSSTTNIWFWTTIIRNLNSVSEILHLKGFIIIFFVSFMYSPTVSHGSSLCTQKSFLKLKGRKNKPFWKSCCWYTNGCVTYYDKR